MLALFKVAGLLIEHPVSFRISQGVSDFVNGINARQLYVLHNIIGWVYSGIIISRLPGGLKDVNSMYVPIWYVKFSLTLSLVFSLLSIYQLNS